MTPNQSDITGLELALQQWNNGGPAAHFAAQLRGLIEQAKAAPQAEPVGSVYTHVPLVPGGEVISHARLFHSLPGGTQLYAAPPVSADHIPDSAKMVQVCKFGAYGTAYDWPDTCRAYTYAEQPGNDIAYRLGTCLRAAQHDSSGDFIDTGLNLLRRLEEKGFGVFQIATPAPASAGGAE